MDAYFALFNCHVNNALEKTTEKYKEIWGAKRFEKKIQPFIDNGIMSIFNTKPNRDLKFFVFYNADVVNAVR